MKALNLLSKNIRRYSLMAIHAAESGHPGGTLSCAELLASLWGREMRLSSTIKKHVNRDRFVLSKGHACPALYAAAAEVGLIPHYQLLGLRKLGSSLQGHPHFLTTPWVEASTGSLGQGFSSGIGMAMGLRYIKNPARVYTLLGDGELQEGEVWEGAMCAAHHALSNLCAIIDYNKMQSDELNADVIGLEPLVGKWQAFGWHVIEVNGHECNEICAAFEQARSIENRPTVIIAHTLKGRGVSYMEGLPAWHGSLKLSDDELIQALIDLDTPQETIDAYFTGTLWHE